MVDQQQQQQKKEQLEGTVMIDEGGPGLACSVSYSVLSPLKQQSRGLSPEQWHIQDFNHEA